MDPTDTGNPGSTLHDLGEAAAKIRDEIRGYLAAENLTPDDREEAQEYEEAVGRWDLPFSTFENTLRDVKLRRCRKRLFPLMGRIHARLLQLVPEFPPLAAFLQQLEQLPVVTDHEHAGHWRQVAQQLDIIVQLLHDAEIICRANVYARPGPGASQPHSSKGKLTKEDRNTIRRIQELATELGGGHPPHKEICDRLDAEKRPLPSSVRWPQRSWCAAYNDAKLQAAVRTWISKAIHKR
jgi:hypothetical protein